MESDRYLLADGVHKCTAMASDTNDQVLNSDIDGVCPTLKRLFQEYDSVLRDHSEAIADLTSRMGTVPKDEYERLLGVSEQKRLQVEQARLATGSHKSRHGC